MPIKVGWWDASLALQSRLSILTGNESAAEA